MKPKSVTTRRSFFCKAGGALGVAAAGAVAGAAAKKPDDAAALRQRLATLEDTAAIRELHRAYVAHLNERQYEALTTLFADPSQALQPVRECVVVEPTFEHDVVELAVDGNSATARFECVLQAESPLESHWP